jgi:acetylornithine deacetylase/succinyl-diaminopimelate desuccinylase-like protein
MSTTTDEFVQSNQDRFLEELKQFLRIPSISTLPEHKGDIDRAALRGRRSRQRRMENIEIIQTAGHPLIYADWLHAPGKPTVLCCGHYDVQPATRWRNGKARPSSPPARRRDTAAAPPTTGQMYMTSRLLEKRCARSRHAPINEILVEGEEEVGGESIAKFVAENPGVKADVALVSDTEMWAPGMPTPAQGCAA